MTASPERLEPIARQQATIADLGRRALVGEELEQLLHRAVEEVSRALAVEYAKVLELLPDRDRFLLRAGVGWQDGLVGTATVSAGPGSQAGFTLLADGPVVVTDLRSETRFVGTPFLHEHGVVAGISTVIRGRGQPFGVLSAHTRTPREFRQDEVVFLRGVANVLGATIEQRRGEERVRAGEERFRGLIDSAPNAVLIVDEGGRIAYGNRTAEQLFGYEPGELVETPLDRLVPDRFRVEHASHRRSYHADPATRAMGGGRDLAGQRKDGTEFPVEIGLSSFVSGGKRMISATIVDISARKHLEAQLLQAQKMESIGRLAGGVAHDFNNMLTAIRGYTDLVLVDPTLDPGHRSSLEAARAAADRAGALTQQLLAVSRRQVLQPKVVALNAVVAAIEPMLRRLIGEDIALSTRLHARVDTVLVDQSQLDQVILNLVVNGRDAMPQGGALTIETSHARFDEPYALEHFDVSPGEYVVLTVADTGVGMDRETQARVFEPFFTTKELGRGTGLGLATSYGIVRQSGGHIWLYSEPGMGTTFKVYFPRAEGRSEEARGRPAVIAPRGRGTVLVVEDEEIVRRLTRRLLERDGYSVIDVPLASDALDAIEHALEPIAAVVTDVVMPGMSGVQLAARLHQDRPDLPVLFVSGYTAEALDVEDRLAPHVGFLPKPYAPGDLSARLREVMEAGAMLAAQRASS